MYVLALGVLLIDYDPPVYMPQGTGERRRVIFLSAILLCLDPFEARFVFSLFIPNVVAFHSTLSFRLRRGAKRQTKPGVTDVTSRAKRVRTYGKLYISQG